MKCYVAGFRLEGDNNPHPPKAHPFPSLKKAERCYAEFVMDCDNFGMGNPGPAFVYLGKPDGDEETCGYPDCPDFIIEVGERGGIIRRRG